MSANGPNLITLAVSDIISPSHFPDLAVIELNLFQREGPDAPHDLRAPADHIYAGLRDADRRRY